MANIKKLEYAGARNVYIDINVLKQIVERDPAFNLSAECQAMLKEKLDLLKKEEAPVDAINARPFRQEEENLPNNRQLSLFEAFASKDLRSLIVQYGKEIKDPQQRANFILNGRAMGSVFLPANPQRYQTK